MENNYTIDQRYQLAMMLRTLKKEINTAIDGLLTSKTQEHEMMLLCEQLSEFPELTHTIRQLTLEHITLNNLPIRPSLWQKPQTTNRMARTNRKDFE